jgi:hypothetical protein
VRQSNDFFNLGAEHPYFFEATIALHQAMTEASLAGDWGTGYETEPISERRLPKIQGQFPEPQISRRVSPRNH